MKKGKTLYYMLPLILAVWGFVFYQCYNYFFSKPNYAIEEIKEVIDISEIKKDTFSIIANYRDPFLGKKVQQKTARRNSSSNVNGTFRAVKKASKVEKRWPNISYKGMIKNNNSNRRVGILSVSGKEQLIKENDMVSGVQIISIDKNTVEVLFQKETKTITK